MAGMVLITEDLRQEYPALCNEAARKLRGNAATDLYIGVSNSKNLKVSRVSREDPASMVVVRPYELSGDAYTDFIRFSGISPAILPKKKGEKENTEQYMDVPMIEEYLKRELSALCPDLSDTKELTVSFQKNSIGIVFGPYSVNVPYRELEYMEVADKVSNNLNLLNAACVQGYKKKQESLKRNVLKRIRTEYRNHVRTELQKRVLQMPYVSRFELSDNGYHGSFVEVSVGGAKGILYLQKIGIPETDYLVRETVDGIEQHLPGGEEKYLDALAEKSLFAHGS